VIRSPTCLKAFSFTNHLQPATIDAMEQIHCIISGKVQNVFLRSYIKECADKYDILGFVQNLENGTVEVVVEGNSSTLTKFLSDVRQGSSMSQIESIDTTWGHATKKFDHFSIKHDK